MSTNAIQSISNIDINKITFSDPRTNKNGGKSISIRYNNVPLQLRLPKLTYSGGMKSKVNKQNVTEYSLKIFLKGCDPNTIERASTELGDMGIIYNFLLDLRQKVFENVQKNSIKIWNKERSKEGLEENYNLFLKPPVKLVNDKWVPDNKYPPSLTMKVPIYNDDISMSVVDAQGKPIQITIDNMVSYFPKYVNASIVVTPNIYITGNSFGVSWKINFARVTPPSKLSAVDVFADEIEEGEEDTTTRNLENEFEAEYQRMQEEVTKPIVKEEPKVVEEPAVNIPAAPTKNRRRQQAA